MADGPERFLEVERLGGLAGIGGPRSRLRSRGRVELDALSAADRAAVEALFAARRPKERGAARDAFRYRVTRTRGAQVETIEVLAEELPAALSSCVKDKLR